MNLMPDVEATSIDTAELIAKSIQSAHASHAMRVAIDGPDAVGKTTLADKVTDHLHNSGRHVIRSSIDNFHNPQAKRYEQGRTSPVGYYEDSFNLKTLIDELLVPLASSTTRQVRTQVFDYRTDSPVMSSFEEVQSDSILVFDGVFLLRPELRDHWDYRVLLMADFDALVQRGVNRDSRTSDEAEIRSLYETRYRPGQLLYLSSASPWLYADLIVDNTNFSAPRIISPEEASTYL